MFGTISTIIYGGCGYGADYPANSVTSITEMAVPSTNVIRVAASQSGTTEAVTIDLANIQLFG